jgi:hypothetical protein
MVDGSGTGAAAPSITSFPHCIVQWNPMLSPEKGNEEVLILKSNWLSEITHDPVAKGLLEGA